MIRVGIIIGSTRPGRVGAQIAGWVQGRSMAADASVDLIDLADIGLPFLDEAEHPSAGLYANEHSQRWSRRIQGLDALVLVTPEYNHSFGAPMKNALDFLSSEWHRKPVAMVGYGMTSAGTRGVHALLPVVVALGMIPVGAVFLPLRDRVDASGRFLNTPNDDAGLDDLLANLLDLTAQVTSAPLVATVAS